MSNILSRLFLKNLNFAAFKDFLFARTLSSYKRLTFNSTTLSSSRGTEELISLNLFITESFATWIASFFLSTFQTFVELLISLLTTEIISLLVGKAPTSGKGAGAPKSPEEVEVEEEEEEEEEREEDMEEEEEEEEEEE